jgi:hypothetical protein
MSIPHFLLSGAVIALGLYLLGHPKVLSARTRLVRTVVIWAALVIALHGLNFIFLQ